MTHFGQELLKLLLFQHKTMFEQPLFCIYIVNEWRGEYERLLSAPLPNSTYSPITFTARIYQTVMSQQLT